MRYVFLIIDVDTARSQTYYDCEIDASQGCVFIVENRCDCDYQI